MLLVHVHHAVLMGGSVAGHLLGVVVVGVVHQVGDGHGDGHVATAVVVVLVMRRMDQVMVVVVVRMHQMVQRIAADGMRRNGAPRVVVAVAFVIDVICAGNSKNGLNSNDWLLDRKCKCCVTMIRHVYYSTWVAHHHHRPSQSKSNPRDKTKISDNNLDGLHSTGQTFCFSPSRCCHLYLGL